MRLAVWLSHGVCPCSGCPWSVMCAMSTVNCVHDACALVCRTVSRDVGEHTQLPCRCSDRTCATCTATFVSISATGLLDGTEMLLQQYAVTHWVAAITGNLHMEHVLCVVIKLQTLAICLSGSRTTQPQGEKQAVFGRLLSLPG